MDLEPIRADSEIFVQKLVWQVGKAAGLFGKLATHDPAQRSEHPAVPAQTDRYYN